MRRFITVYSVLLALYELPTIASLLLRGGKLCEATPWFDSSPLFERRSYAWLYAGVLGLLAVSRLLSAHLPRHRLVQLHNAVLHVVEALLFAALAYSKRPPPPAAASVGFLAVMCFNSALFIWQMILAFKPREKRALGGVLDVLKKEN